MSSNPTPPERKNNARSKAEAETRDTFTRRSLVTIIQAQWPQLARREVVDLVECVIDEIVEGIVREGNVKLHGFGAFIVREKASRPGRNPRTGEAAEVTPRKSVIFKASPNLKARVQGDGVA